MPAAAFILMAAEAARQIFVAAGRTGGSIVMSDVLFDCLLPLSLFGTAPNVELHLNSHSTGKADEFSFQIFFLLPGPKDSSKQLCSGCFRWNEKLTQQRDYVIQHSSHDYDTWLLDQAQALVSELSCEILNLKIDSRGSTGMFEHLPNPFDHYCIDPATLHCIIELASISTSQRSVAFVQRIASIKSLRFPLAEGTARSKGCFSTDVRPTSSNVTRANVGVSLGDNYAISISDVLFEQEKAIDQKPAPRSLFFKPVILPDITKVKPAADPKPLFECLRLVTHKWPMSDIAIAGMTGRDADIILDSIQRVGPGGRQHFRSVTVMGHSENYTSSSKIRFAHRFADGLRYHLVCQGHDHIDIQEALSLVIPNGLLCVRIDDEREGHLLKHFMKLWDVKGINDRDTWSLWRSREPGLSNQQPASHLPLTLFGTQDQLLAFRVAFPDAEQVLLEQAAIRSFLERKKAPGGSCDAIIIDSIDKPIITTWPGQDLVPWLQLLLTSYGNLLWVTPNSCNCHPHHGVAGNLLRSLQAEQPSLKTAWLLFEDGIVTKMQETVVSTYQKLTFGHGDNEVVVELTHSGSNIVRYFPDDELSISTGVSLPRSAVTSNLRRKNYEIIYPLTVPTVLAWSAHGWRALNTGKVRVNIEASVIDSSDVSAIQHKSGIWKHPLTFRFFAGRVHDHGQADFAIGSQVVGWYQGSHCGQVDVPAACLYRCSAGDLPAASAAEFACLCASLSVVDGAARARKGDIFKIRTQYDVGKSVAKLCTEFGAETLESNATVSATFTVDIATDGALLVNDVPVDVEDYLTSRRGVDMLCQHWKNREPRTLSSKVLSLAEIEKWFPLLEPQDVYSTVLNHSDRESVSGVTVKRNSGSLFTSDGTYVLIGGLGGLGRFVCSWMVENGAKRLSVISRSGLQSQEARDTHTAITDSHAFLEVIRADASDRVAMQDALSQIRKTSRIKGILNLAMVLEDSQFASMTGEQWDRAVGLKRDSSWILHEETLNDRLDFFILVSSIASVLGNRGQGNYNIGNTFLNALAKYRRSIGLTAISVALGAMSKSFDRMSNTQSY
jgi:KR domain